MLLQTFAGQETFPNATCKIALFYRNFKVNGEEDAIHIAMRDRNSGIKLLNNSFLNAGVGNRNNGRWIESRYNVPGSTYFKLWMQRKVGSAIFYDKAQVLFFMRKEAALQRIRMELTCHQHATVTAGYIEGNFDIIKPSMFRKLGVKDARGNFDLEDWEDMITVNTMEREISKLILPSLVKIERDGEIVTIRKIKKRRRIRL